MPIIRINPDSPDPGALRQAADTLRSGGVVAFATETVYGIGANALDAAAVQKVYSLKQRPGFNPLIVHVEDAAAAKRIVRSWPETAARLAERFWPGPLTLILPKKDLIPDTVTAGLDSVAVRAPAHPLAQVLLRASGLPLAAPSANRFTQLSPTSAAHVAKAFGDELLILDGGDCEVGIESTVLDLTGVAPTLLRPGGISRQAIETVIGPVRLPGRKVEGDAPRPSPGMVERHYAPKARLLVLPAGEMAAAVENALSSKLKTCALQIDAQPLRAEKSIAMPGSPAEYARMLYATLHALDDEGFDVIVVEAPPQGEEWTGVRDRLQRASK